MKFFEKLLFALLIIIVPCSYTVSCYKNKPNEELTFSGFLTGIVIPIQIELTPHSEFAITGTGFAQGDKVFFETDDTKIEATVAAVTASSITIIVPASLENEKQYKIVVFRGTQSQMIGTTVVSVKVIANVVIPVEIRAAGGDEITLSGNGFIPGDQIVFAQKMEAVAETKNITSAGITIIVPSEVDNGATALKMRRAGKDYYLGESILILSISLNVVDKPGATIKGVVYSGGRVLSGVSVSDGDLIVQTDINGCYWLNSTKRNKSVFVITPSGFEANVTEGMPQFWTPCTQASTVTEQINFALSPRDNNKHTMIVFTDAHLANRNSPLDYMQFRDGILSELKDVYNNRNDVIALNLGDFSWDLYWYDNRFSLPEAKKELASLNFPVFSTMGNHDNDPYVVGDFAGEEKWREVMGPVYYSMNIGQIHYVMLDNVIWTNTGGAQGVVGNRSYSTGIDSYQLEWLRKDLALVDRNTPVIIGFHIPCITYSGVSNGQYVRNNVVAGMEAVLTELRKFNTVHILTGHSHDSRNITIDYQKGAYERREHNMAAASATWWWTNRYTPNHVNIAPDGTPGGYKVFDIDGKNVKWRYKAVGLPAERQFIAFDMNEVKKYWTTNSSALTAFSYSDFSVRANDYNSINENEVLINVWAFEQDFWKIKVMEGNSELPVDAVWIKCPLHTISYEIPRRAAGSAPTASFVSSNTSHIYRVKTSSATSTLEITVEDRFGNVFTDTMKRPKALTTAIE